MPYVEVNGELLIILPPCPGCDMGVGTTMADEPYNIIVMDPEPHKATIEEMEERGHLWVYCHDACVDAAVIRLRAQKSSESSNN